jgi:hypothetical protein
MNLSRKKKVLKTLNNLKKSKSKLAALLFTGVLPVQIKEKERKKDVSTGMLPHRTCGNCYSCKRCYHLETLLNTGKQQ